MDVELVTEGVSDEDTFGFDDNNDEYATFEGERCGICMDIVIDRGVLDCCQHWFCFACIDNWATITNLCPLCQNEFQLITCVPVYDTIGSNNIDEDSDSRDGDWCIEGKNNILSFPSYYINENAVVCLDGDGCKVRSRSATIEEDSNLDTSIACDSCDIWYHAFCVGFDTEGTYENSWLCPRCVVNKTSKNVEGLPVSKPGNQFNPANGSSDYLVNANFSGEVSVSVADDGETAIVVSMVEGNQVTEEPTRRLLPNLNVEKNVKIDGDTFGFCTNNCKLETTSSERICIEPSLGAKELEQSLSQQTSFSQPSNSLLFSKLKTNFDDKAIREPRIFEGVQIFTGQSGEPLEVDKISNNIAEEQVAGDVQQKNSLEECLLSAEKIMVDERDSIVGITGAKRKHGDCSAEDGGTRANIETRISAKKIKTEDGTQLINSKDQAYGCLSDDLRKFPSLTAVSEDEKSRHTSEKETISTNIMDIVQGTDRKAPGRMALTNLGDISSVERENAAGFRVKKIMRRAAEDVESSMLVQKLRKEIREVVRDKSKELGENLFDPKLLAAFRAAVAGPVTETKKLPPVYPKANKSLLQKGKVREHLTKKIYGIGGRRKRAWTRDCEIEFWKRRCLETAKPEKIETLKSVLSVLRSSSEDREIEQVNDGEASNSILSRLYLADTSVFPRKDDIKPFSTSRSTGVPESEEHTSMQKASVGYPVNHSCTKNTVSSIKGEAASSKVHPNRDRPSVSTSAGCKIKPQREIPGKSDDMKIDKRKWALDVLARKMAVTGKNSALEEKDNAILKGNYPLLAQLPVDMRPAMAPIRHNKIPISIRQAQLYRLTEHLLKKANLPVIRRTAETELAVADAVNIEKQIADRSNSKLVYVNLCSQELLHRLRNIKADTATEFNPSSTSAVHANRSVEAACNYASDSVVDEALRNAGLLSDSPPNSPHHQVEEIKAEVDTSRKMEEEGANDVFEMYSHPDLDIYGDFDYDLEDEDFIGASALKISRPEGDSKLKVVFSTVNSDPLNGAQDIDNPDGAAIVDESENSSSLLLCHADTSIGCSIVNDKTDNFLPQNSLVGGGEEPSLAECEELYGPDKEPLINKLPGGASIKPCELIANSIVPGENEGQESDQVVRTSGSGTKNHAGNHGISVGENSPNCYQTIDNVPTKEKISSVDSSKQPNSCNSVCKKVEAYIKEHIRPLCKSGVITVEQYRWAVAKTTDKIMKYHSRDTNANFLIKEGEKVKKLAEQYVEAAQKGKS